MLTECLFAACTLGIVIVGLGLTLQMVTVEQILHVVWRGILLGIAALAAVWVLRAVAVAFIMPAVVALKTVTGWLLMAMTALVALSLIVQWLLSRFRKHAIGIVPDQEER